MFFSRFRVTARPAIYRIPDGVRVYAVGDIHGRYDLMCALLDKIEHDRRDAVSSQIVFLGDYIDRGPDSRRVIEALITGADRDGWICLKGNHEAMWLGALDRSQPWDGWLANGGVETLFSYGISARGFSMAGREDGLREAVLASVPGEHIAFIRQRPTSHAVGGYFFCHAGIRPGVPLSQQAPDDLMWIRDLFVDSRLDHGGRIVHGHTPAIEPEVLANRINVDTGAYLTGRLTCVALEGDRVRIIHT
ncbi:metallophosphoesterase family protein [Ancylobacter amanitiformis]|uniref:Serine/threonine protein phosphatase 1 n=1 Tax=Ancylobacter amanitiformis TaxID=217069 RepID=A0ABU0LL32_9HYPH|nr:metallophosphoesterase family protein [Ancylobacter amanitiformis]MDQ0509372.1 serine/threonine protein phosphatase 1 [Ancylobacter amanitiformis]